MKLGNLLLPLMVTACTALADGLPVITTQPQSDKRSPGVPVTFSVVSANATDFQWRFNGTNIPGATSSTLPIANPQTTDSGYYMVVAKNATGWVPSQMAWLSVGSSSLVPFSNKTNNYFQGQACNYYGTPLNNCLATVVAGPTLDQMQPIGSSIAVVNGYYGNSTLFRIIPTVAPGQACYYRVDIAPSYDLGTAQSTVLKLTAGGGVFPTPSVYGLKFPRWWVGEGLEPILEYPSTPTNQVRIPGETFSLTNTYYAYTDFGIPTAQWRKNGNPILGATNFPNVGPNSPQAGDFQAVLTITNVQPADAGIYDLVVLGNNWIVGPKTTLSIQLTNGPGVFRSPRNNSSGFVCDLLGVAGRNYAIQWSSNLSSWNDLKTVSNATGTAAFTNAPAPAGTRYYRARLVP